MLPNAENEARAAPEETARLEALSEYALFDTPPEADLNRLVELAARIYATPLAVLSLVGHDRLFFKARFGLHATGIARDGSFCSHAIENDGVFVVPDASKDDRFASHPLVREPPQIRFYAGIPLSGPSGHKIGTLCILDIKPWPAFTEDDRRTLQDVAALIISRLEQRRLDQAKQGGHLLYERIASTSPDAIVCADGSANINYWNGAAEKLFGYSAGEATGRPLGFIFPEHVRDLQSAEVMSIVNCRASTPANQQLRLLAQRRDGGKFPVELSLSTWREGDKVSFGAILRDVTDRQHGEQRLFNRAHIDPLTGLPGRRYLFDRLDQIVATTTGTLLLVDLDGFKYVNDSLGHSAGDLVLTETADRLQSHLGPDASIARLGADEFAILLPGLADRLRAARTADDLLRVFAAPFAVDGQPVHVGANIGIAMFPAHGADAEEICANTNLALQRAKATPGSGYQFYKPSLRQAVMARRSCEAELRKALSEEQFELYYQPQVRLSDRSIIGAEALLRWRHPERGLLAPNAFLSVLEASPLAVDVGNWVLKTACADAAIWRRSSCPEFRIAVNLFGAQFNGGDLPTHVEQTLLQTKLPPEALELEITENIMLRHDENVTVPLREMRAWGVDIAFDDYGTGYASLSLLKRYPVSRLKIDRSFVRDLCADAEDAAIVQAIMYLGRRFGLGIIAEGIEAEPQEEVLRMYGCPEGQGYLYGRPVPAAALAGYLHQDRERTVA
jgi:diguanylate cyclase (GGDEF)-like protein/PAS domain S-box-containing protein